MTELASDDRGQRNAKPNIIREIVGQNQFDDRIDVQSDLTTLEALRVIGRAAQQLAAVKGLFGVKLVFELGLLIAALYVPWLAKVVIDNVIQQEPFGTTEIPYPFFFDPVLALIIDKDPMQIMLIVAAIYVFGLVLVGIRTNPLSASLLQGQDAATQAENQMSASYSSGSGLWGLAAFMVGVRLTQRLVDNLRTRLFKRLSHLPMAVLDDQRIGDSIYRVMYDVPMAPDLFHQITIVPLLMAINAIVNFYIMDHSYGEVAPELVWIAWATFPAAFFITFPFSGAIRRTSQNKRAAGSATTNAMEESVTNVAAVQSLGATGQQSSQFADRSEQSFLRERYYLATIIVCASILAGVAGIAAIYVTILVSDRIIDGVMSVGDFGVLFGIYSSIVTPAAYLGAYWIKIQDVIAATRRVFFFMDFESEQDSSEGHECVDIKKSVTFEQVSYLYPNGTQALVDVNLTLNIGELVAVVGPTGSGKTTLAYLIPSLLTPTTGRVLIDGQDVRDFDLPSVRRHTAYVLQEHTFLEGTIRRNLWLANPNATEPDILEALEMAGCMEFIERLPDGLDTHLGRGGDTLSVGQQQRLSIARGLVRHARVLILDEPTAALDPQTERALLASLQTVSSDRLVVVIAHRLSTIRNADRIVFMEDGRIQEIGSHDELMHQATSSYRDFVQLQRAAG